MASRQRGPEAVTEHRIIKQVSHGSQKLSWLENTCSRPLLLVAILASKGSQTDLVFGV